MTMNEGCAYIEERCIHCGGCVRESEDGGVKLETLEGGRTRIVFDFSMAEDWNLIAQVCPVGAICLIRN